MGHSAAMHATASHRRARGRSLFGPLLILVALGALAWGLLQRRAAEGVTVHGVDGEQTQLRTDNAGTFARQQACLIECTREARDCRALAADPDARGACADTEDDCAADCRAADPSGAGLAEEETP